MAGFRWKLFPHRLSGRCLLVAAALLESYSFYLPCCHLSKVATSAVLACCCISHSFILFVVHVVSTFLV